MELLSFEVAGRSVSALLVACLILPVGGRIASAQDVPANQIINALSPPSVTRSVVPDGQDPANRAFVEGIRHRTRSLTLDERDHVAAIAKDRPKIDLEIYFDYNSAILSPKAEPQLNELGKALRSPELGSSVFALAGHTDAKGSDDYNQRLSERRAEAVKKYLVAKLNIPSENLTTAGYGKRDLKDPANPFGAKNRRVQILNLGSSDETKR
jgi:outer membrane protein OmpA-like peptidoglycan-associated protein